MIRDVYVYNKNLERIGVIDGFRSCIWDNQYSEIGECELYVAANEENLSMLVSGYYLARDEDSMACIIRKIEIDTSAEEGNYLIVTGIDSKVHCDQRIIEGTEICKGRVENFLHELAYNNIFNPVNTARRMLKPNGFTLIGFDYSGLTESDTRQISYANLGETYRETCTRYKWGYRFRLFDNAGNNELRLNFYKGVDRSNEVVFSHKYENISTSSYVHDETNQGNLAMIGGEGEGNLRTWAVCGNASGLDRFERYVDARDVSRQMSFGELKKSYPLAPEGEGSVIESGGKYYYQLAEAEIDILDDSQLDLLEQLFPDGYEHEIDGNRYFHCENANIAEVESATPEDSSNTVLLDVIYNLLLLSRGVADLSEYGITETFEGSVIPDVTFVYKRDYFLGDVVTVENEFGISAKARIVEVIEVMDENGYSVEPKFEYIG